MWAGGKLIDIMPPAYYFWTGIPATVEKMAQR